MQRFVLFAAMLAVASFCVPDAARAQCLNCVKNQQTKTYQSAWSMPSGGSSDPAATVVLSAPVQKTYQSAWSTSSGGSSGTRISAGSSGNVFSSGTTYGSTGNAVTFSGESSGSSVAFGRADTVVLSAPVRKAATAKVIVPRVGVGNNTRAAIIPHVTNHPGGGSVPKDVAQRSSREELIRYHSALHAGYAWNADVAVASGGSRPRVNSNGRIWDVSVTGGIAPVRRVARLLTQRRR